MTEEELEAELARMAKEYRKLAKQVFKEKKEPVQVDREALFGKSTSKMTPYAAMLCCWCAVLLSCVFAQCVRADGCGGG